MNRLMEASVLFSIIAGLAGSTTGCSVIGYFVGGAIDQPGQKVVSVRVTHVSDSSSWEPRSPLPSDVANLKSLLADIPLRGNPYTLSAVSPESSATGRVGKGAQVEIVNRYLAGLFPCSGLIVDTPLVAVSTIGDSAREGLFFGEEVCVSIRDSGLIHASGVVVRLDTTHLLLRMQNHYRRLAVETIDSIWTHDGTLFEGRDLRFSHRTGRFARETGLLAVSEQTRIFFPLREIDEVRVLREYSTWGTARSIFVGVGGGFDLLMVLGIILIATGH